MAACCGGVASPSQQLMGDGGPGFSRVPDKPDRIVISPQGTYVLNGVECVMMGGNYIVKAPPYYPPLSVVKEDARLMAEGVRKMKFRPAPAADGSARKVVAAVRLAAMWESSMPDMPKASPGSIDPTFAQRLDETVAAFKAQGVYVFLDTHEDAMCTTNGGEGMPWWVAAEMQRTDEAGCCGYRSAFCRCGTASYVTSPQHPLMFCCPLPNCILKCIGMDFKTAPGDSDPWRAYSVGSNDGDPARMNIGNASMRLNNYDIEWGKLGNAQQCNNLWNRFLESPFQPDDKALIFDQYMVHIRHLCSVWEKHHNVVAVGLWNEPSPSGFSLTEFHKSFFSIRRTYDFYGAVLGELDAMNNRAPVTLEELPTGGLQNMTCLTKLMGCAPISAGTHGLLKQWAQRGQLILQFHYYPGPMMVDGIKAAVDKAKERAAQLAEGVPVFLGEFWPGSGTVASAEAGGKLLAQFTEAGCNASIFWLYTNTKFTDGNPGWYKYTPAVQAAGGPIINETRELNTAVWPEYEKTVRDGTSWGGHITGSGTGIMGALELVPANSSD